LADDHQGGKHQGGISRDHSSRRDWVRPEPPVASQKRAELRLKSRPAASTAIKSTSSWVPRILSFNTGDFARYRIPCCLQIIGNVCGMPDYNIAFGKKLAEVANLIVDDGLDDPASPRVVLYLSLLSTEISLKAMLEKAGKPVAEIRKRSHKLADLLTDLSQCEIEVEIAGAPKFVPASRLRAYSLKQGDGEVTIGKVIDAESEGASSYPNNVRYGDLLQHFQPPVVAQMASMVAAFADKHWQTIRAQ
jgi:hypothetical protein